MSGLMCFTNSPQRAALATLDDFLVVLIEGSTGYSDDVIFVLIKASTGHS